ncbi:MAG TPA: D-alanine--D-alanine ligase family protein [Myxococcota bacterium]|jgi:D-alanine-D-alanine ligase
MRVGLVFGGRSVEHVVSVRSARTVLEGLRAAGHEVVPLAVDENGAWTPPDVGARVFAGTDKAVPVSRENARASLRHLSDAQVECVFPIVHGTYGEDGTLQGLFEMLDLPYVGCGVLASSVAMDKLQSKRLFAAAGLPVVPYFAVTRAAFASSPEAALTGADAFGATSFVKPAVGGSSVGCQKVKARADLAAAVRFALQFDDVVLVEKCVTAREIEVAVLGHAGALRASAIGEIVPGNDFYDYEDKYLKDDAKLLAPAPIDDAAAAQIRALGVRAMESIGGSGLARVDFFLAGTELYLNEINTLPGFTSVSMYPRLWGLAGVPLPELVDTLVQIGVARHASKQRLDESLRAFVDSVKS